VSFYFDYFEINYKRNAGRVFVEVGNGTDGNGKEFGGFDAFFAEKVDLPEVECCLFQLRSSHQQQNVLVRDQFN
jgi:hypothetical protein